MEATVKRASISSSLPGPLVLTVSGVAVEKEIFGQFVQIILLTMAVRMGLHYYTRLKTSQLEHRCLLPPGFAFRGHGKRSGETGISESEISQWDSSQNVRDPFILSQAILTVTEERRKAVIFYVFKVPKTLVLAMPQQKPDLLGQEYLISALKILFCQQDAGTKYFAKHNYFFKKY